MDETVYKNPDTFAPERYLAQHGGEPFPTGKVFGFGRRSARVEHGLRAGGLTHRLFSSLRICPGRHLAEASVWIVVASILAVFDISAEKDAQGRDIVPEVAFTNAITRYVRTNESRFLSLLTVF